MKVVGYRLELGGSDPAIFQHLRPIKPSMKRYTGKMMDMDAKKSRFLHVYGVYLGVYTAFYAV